MGTQIHGGVRGDRILAEFMPIKHAHIITLLTSTLKPDETGNSKTLVFTSNTAYSVSNQKTII